MAGKNFWEEKWLKDQYNQRNPGQANNPNSRRGSETVSLLIAYRMPRKLRFRVRALGLVAPA
jgi:hypothetical protein